MQDKNRLKSTFHLINEKAGNLIENNNMQNGRNAVMAIYGLH